MGANNDLEDTKIIEADLGLDQDYWKFDIKPKIFYSVLKIIFHNNWKL